MAFKPNYKQQRAERTRAKQAKTEEKLREQQEMAAKRKTIQDAEFPDGAPAGAAPDESPAKS